MQFDSRDHDHSYGIVSLYSCPKFNSNHSTYIDINSHAECPNIDIYSYAECPNIDINSHAKRPNTRTRNIEAIQTTRFDPGKRQTCCANRISQCYLHNA